MISIFFLYLLTDSRGERLMRQNEKNCNKERKKTKEVKFFLK